MSIFSRLRAAKRAADEVKGAKKDAERDGKPAPYKHVPTHAAVDALSGAPLAWRARDKALIRFHNHRQSKMSKLSRHSSMIVMNHPSSSLGGFSLADDRSDRRAKQGNTSHDSGVSGIGKSNLSKEVTPSDVTPSGSSSHSSSSQTSHVLEMRPPLRNFRSQDAVPRRKLGEAPILVAPPSPPSPSRSNPKEGKRKWRLNGKSHAGSI